MLGEDVGIDEKSTERVGWVSQFVATGEMDGGQCGVEGAGCGRCGLAGGVGECCMDQVGSFVPWRLIDASGAKPCRSC